MNEFPRMLYKVGGPHEIHGGLFDTLIVNDDDELDAALAKGWAIGTVEAKAAALAPTKTDEQETTPAMSARDEMKIKADELGLTYAHNISNAKLAELIDAALAKG